jgi:hypothetical protein
LNVSKSHFQRKLQLLDSLCCHINMRKWKSEQIALQYIKVLLFPNLFAVLLSCCSTFVNHFLINFLGSIFIEGVQIFLLYYFYFHLLNQIEFSVFEIFFYLLFVLIFLLLLFHFLLFPKLFNVYSLKHFMLLLSI